MTSVSAPITLDQRRAALDELRTALYRGHVTDEQAAAMLTVLAVVTRAASDIADDWPFVPAQTEAFRDYIARSAVENCVQALDRLTPPAVIGPGCESCGAVDELALADPFTLCTSCRDAGDQPASP